MRQLNTYIIGACWLRATRSSVVLTRFTLSCRHDPRTLAAPSGGREAGALPAAVSNERACLSSMLRLQARPDVVDRIMDGVAPGEWGPAAEVQLCYEIKVRRNLRVILQPVV